MNVPKLRFKEFNDEYKKLKYKDVLKIKSGKDQKRVECLNGKYPILGTGGKIGETNNFLYDKPSVLIGRKGTINKPQYMETPFWTVDTLFYSHIFEPNIPKYLFYSFQNVNWKKYDESTGVPSLSSSTIENVECHIPTIKEQTKVANFLSLLDKKIELQTKKIEDLKLFKKGLLNKLVDDIVLEQKCKLSDLGNSYSGISGKTKEDFNCGDAKYIPFMNVLKNNIDILNLPSINICSGEKQNKVKNGDLFFTISSETKEEVGMCATLKNNVENVYLNSFCFGFRIKDNNMMNNEFLCYLLLSKKYRKIISNLGQGFTRVNISKNQLLDIEVEIPSIDVQKKISKTITCLEKHIDLECNILYKLNELKKGLMQNMFV